MSRYQWISYYSNSSLSQFDNNVENLFSKIDLNKLERFEVSGPEHVISVNLKTGIFLIDNIPMKFKCLGDSGFRLVYFRKNRASMVLGTNNSTIKTWHIIGLQNTIQDTNRKVLLYIDNDSGHLEWVFD